MRRSPLFAKNRLRFKFFKMFYPPFYARIWIRYFSRFVILLHVITYHPFQRCFPISFPSSAFPPSSSSFCSVRSLLLTMNTISQGPKLVGLKQKTVRQLSTSFLLKNEMLKILLPSIFFWINSRWIRVPIHVFLHFSSQKKKNECNL